MKSRRKKSPRKTNFVFNPLFRNLGLLNADPLVLRFRHFIGSFPQPRFDEALQTFWHHADKYLWQKGQLVCESDLGRLENEAYLALYETGEYESPLPRRKKTRWRCIDVFDACNISCTNKLRFTRNQRQFGLIL